MYRFVRELVLTVFRAPRGEPAAPGGAHARVEIFRASPRFLAYRLVGLLVGTVLVIGLGGVFVIGGLAAGEVEVVAIGAIVGLFCLGICALGYFSVHLDYDLRYYVFTERSLRVREGAWTVREQTITYANVQNLHVSQGPLQRLFGISDLRVDTAGGGAAESSGLKGKGHAHSITVAGVENASELRDLILAHIKALGSGSGLGDPDDELGTSAPPTTAAGLEAPEVRGALVAVAESARRLRLACETRGA